MAGKRDEVQYDVEGSDVLTEALLKLLNEYPGLPTGERITFATLGDTKGRAMFPMTGAIIERDVADVVGGFFQICRYPFHVVSRAGTLTEERRVRLKEWLDNLGRWLEGQSVTIGGREYRLAAYPELAGEREITQIRRTTPGYLSSINDNKTEDWAIGLSVQYQNEF